MAELIDLLSRMLRMGTGMPLMPMLAIKQAGRDLRRRAIRAWLLARYAFLRLAGERRAVHFYPQVPHKGYGVWKAMQYAGFRFAKEGEKADTEFYWEDSTWATEAPHPDSVNARCRDISKVRLSEIHQEVFGYRAEVDPLTWDGPYLEKSDENGIHDFIVRKEPAEPRPGRVYQRLIDNSTPGGLVIDLRGIVLGGRMRACRITRRYTFMMISVFKHSCNVFAEPPFTKEEMDRIDLVCEAIGLDYGELDLLRDPADGRVYVLDANKTAYGPDAALGWREQMNAIRICADELSRLCA